MIRITPYIARRLLQLANEMREAQKAHDFAPSSYVARLERAKREQLFDRLLAMIATDEEAEETSTQQQTTDE